MNFHSLIWFLFMIIVRDTFFDTVSDQLSNDLASFGIRIDKSTKEALDSLLYVLCEGLKGKLLPEYYLSSLDCGVGKTQAI